MFTESTTEYVVSLAPVGAVETQWANARAGLQFRPHRRAAAEHDLFAIGHNENGDSWDVDNAEPAPLSNSPNTHTSGRC
jgi:hypothetical protein